MKKATSRPRLASAAALRLIGAAVRKTRPPERGADDVATAEYLYVPCARVRYRGSSAETSRWVLEVPVIRKTAKRIYYTSDSWDRIEAVVSPGCIAGRSSRTVARPRTPIPGARPGWPAPLFFATRRAAEHHLYRGECERAGQARPTRCSSGNCATRRPTLTPTAAARRNSSSKRWPILPRLRQS